MKSYITFLSLPLLLACGVQSGTPLPPAATTSAPPATEQVFTPIPTFTAAPQPTTTLLFQLNDNCRTVVFDFTTRLAVFRASLACRTNSNCNVESTLAYYDTNDKYQEIIPIEYYHRAAEPPSNIVWPLNGLTSQTVEFVLVVRAAYQSDPLAAWALWISPRIVR